MAGQPWSERALIAHIAEMAGDNRDRVIKGIGDDCAVLSPQVHAATLVTSDMLVDGVHFDVDCHPPRLLGRKSIAVNLSDIAAMGGTPTLALLSVALPRSLDWDWCREMLAGMQSMLAEFDCTLMGGDTVAGATLTINVTVFGSLEPAKIVYRSGAHAEENIYVTGPLGSAAAGFLILRQKKDAEPGNEALFAPFLSRYLDPLPDVAIGRLLAESQMVTAMQDLSDGLATDLAHICGQSGIGADVERSSLVAHPDLAEVCRLLDADQLETQIGGGEDYHLVFTVKRGADEALRRYLGQRGQRIFHIGRTAAEPGVRVHDGDRVVDVTFSGFQHG